MEHLSMSQCIGLLPAAGLGSRLAPFRYPKELMPIAFSLSGENSLPHPRLAIDFSLEAMRAAGVKRALVVISDLKVEIMRCLGNGGNHALDLCYIHQSVPVGLADAVDHCFEWTKGQQVCLALPDTIVRPINAFATLCAENLRVPCDLHLGVFPTEHPERFGPVRFDPSGRVMEVLEKPKRTEVMNTWGIAVWSDRFSEFLHGALSKDPGARSQSVGLLFNRAVAEGLTVNA